MSTNSHYKQIRQEIEDGNLQEELWLRSLAQSRGDNNKAISFYISLRSDQLYRENTSFSKRTADSAVQALDWRSGRGKVLCTVIPLVIMLITLFSVQPLLRANAAKHQQSLYMKAKAANVIGNTQNHLFKELGRPDESRTTDTSLMFIYNPSSSLCFGRSEYELKVFVDLQTARIAGIGAIE